MAHTKSSFSCGVMVAALLSSWTGCDDLGGNNARDGGAEGAPPWVLYELDRSAGAGPAKLTLNGAELELPSEGVGDTAELCHIHFMDADHGVAIMGDRDGGGTYVFRFDRRAMTWTALPRLPAPFFAPGCRSGTGTGRGEKTLFADGDKITWLRILSLPLYSGQGALIRPGGLCAAHFDGSAWHAVMAGDTCGTMISSMEPVFPVPEEAKARLVSAAQELFLDVTATRVQVLSYPGPLASLFDLTLGPSGLSLNAFTPVSVPEGARGPLTSHYYHQGSSGPLNDHMFVWEDTQRGTWFTNPGLSPAGEFPFFRCRGAVCEPFDDALRAHRSFVAPATYPDEDFLGTKLARHPRVNDRVFVVRLGRDKMTLTRFTLRWLELGTTTVSSLVIDGDATERTLTTTFTDAPTPEIAIYLNDTDELGDDRWFLLDPTRPETLTPAATRPPPTTLRYSHVDAVAPVDTYLFFPD